MKICAISDLHGDLPKNIEPCELVCICGDISPLNIQSNDHKMRRWLINKFFPWATQLPCDKVLFIAGNHDRCLNNLEFMYNIFRKNRKVTYLFHEKYTYISKDGKEYNIFGTPYCKLFGNWAFMELDTMLEKLYEDIPENLDILLSHDAPYGYNDIITEQTAWNTGEHIGNKPLAAAILKKEPKLHIRGHLHSTLKYARIGNTDSYNASIKNEKYESVYDPIYLDI